MNSLIFFWEVKFQIGFIKILWLAGKKGSFDDPFQMFSLVHRITDNPWAVAEATKDVIKDFADDGVVYLELRTTPRCINQHYLSILYSIYFLHNLKPYICNMILGS